MKKKEQKKYKIKIEDDFIPEETLKIIWNEMSGINFPWYYQEFIERNSDKDVLLTHIFLENYYYPFMKSERLSLLSAIVEKINVNAFIRIKANSFPCSDTIREHKMHTDFDFDCTTSIFYLNTNNGPTRFKTGEVVNSVANRLVTFPTKLVHSSSSCTDKAVRYNINFNYFGDDDDNERKRNT